MGFYLSRGSVGDDLESFELDHLRSIKLGANEKSEIERRNEIIDLQTVFNFKKLYQILGQPNKGIIGCAVLRSNLALDSQFSAFFLILQSKPVRLFSRTWPSSNCWSIFRQTWLVCGENPSYDVKASVPGYLIYAGISLQLIEIQDMNLKLKCSELISF